MSRLRSTCPNTCLSVELDRKPLFQASTNRNNWALPITSSEVATGGLEAGENPWIRLTPSPRLCEPPTNRNNLDTTHNFERSEPRGSGGVPPENH
ncbi:hypothetical protein TRICI_004148 [Trichomonascus ciferrii]|uniref:Uncharacterized protein n=1 Tax=Trichomonascus ciferrii TaxID=44093 RepID=A0A642V1U5_9ASCO|nr:hypothetical protein TRICI_004148 [Trichomonascus ciferrii]